MVLVVFPFIYGTSEAGLESLLWGLPWEVKMDRLTGGQTAGERAHPTVQSLFSLSVLCSWPLDDIVIDTP